MYKIITTSDAVQRAFKKYHESVLEYPAEFGTDYQNYDSDTYANNVYAFFMQLLDHEAINVGH